MNGVLLRHLGAAATLALVVFALLAQRTIERGERELQASDRAFDAGQLELSVLHARRAATAYVPGARHVGAGYERLRAVARGAERAGDVELSRRAWRAVRAAAFESRHVWQPHVEALREADAELARWSEARVAAPAELGAGLSAPLLGGLWVGALCALFGWAAAARGNDGLTLNEAPRRRLAALLCVTGVAAWGVALFGT